MSFSSAEVKAAAKALAGYDPDWQDYIRDAQAALNAAASVGVSDEYLINRVEVIDGTGRAYVKYITPGSVFIERQDDRKTLKIFIQESVSDGNQ